MVRTTASDPESMRDRAIWSSNKCSQPSDCILANFRLVFYINTNCVKELLWN
jgi:hypothetical protein